MKKSDKKLKGRSDVDEKAFNYTEKTPGGWQMSDNIWARYFNLDVASNRFGIDPNTIKLTGGKSVFDIYKKYNCKQVFQAKRTQSSVHVSRLETFLKRFRSKKRGNTAYKSPVGPAGT